MIKLALGDTVSCDEDCGGFLLAIVPVAGNCAFVCRWKAGLLKIAARDFLGLTS